VLKPDLVLAGRFTRRATRELLKAQGLRVIEFEAASSVGQVVDQIRRAGALLGTLSGRTRRSPRSRLPPPGPGPPRSPVP
jgi:hypothetical protein